MPIERFLNYYDGCFQRRLGRWTKGVRNIDALSLRFLEIYRAYADQFGPEQIYLFRQEDLRERPGEVYAWLAHALGGAALPDLPARVSSNRAFSALAIHLFFGGVRSKPRRPNMNDVGDPRNDWVRRASSPLRRLRTALVRHGFDKAIYLDWDLLERHGMREQLESYYGSEDQVLSEVAETILAQGPGSQARGVAGWPAT